MLKSQWILVLVSVLLLSSSCTYFRQSGLPFPESPEVQAVKTTINDEPYLCFDYPDAVAMAKWLDKVEAFKHAYER